MQVLLESIYMHRCYAHGIRLVACKGDMPGKGVLRQINEFWWNKYLAVGKSSVSDAHSSVLSSKAYDDLTAN